MTNPLDSLRTATRLRRKSAGFSLIEMMIAITISLLIVAGLGTLLVNLSSSNRELAKINSQIENGRFAIQVLQNDLAHAGYWGTSVPQFDNANWLALPNDTPSVVPDPCLAYNAANWNFAYKDSLIGIPVQALDAVPGSCTMVTDKKDNTDVMVVRRASTCVAGAANCAPDTNGKLYFQASQCGRATAGRAQIGSTATTIKLQATTTTTTTSRAPKFYNGMVIRLTGGTGAGQWRVITDYDSEYNATVDNSWTDIPDNTTTYTIVDTLLDTTGFSLHKPGTDCATAPAADKRQFVSSMYYIRDFATAAGDNMPTLVRSSFDLSTDNKLEHLPAEALVEGIDSFRIELGIDHTVTRCGRNTQVNYGEPIIRAVDPTTCTPNTDSEMNILADNRGDGNPDVFIRCTSTAPCTANQLANVVAAKIFVLARASEPTPGHTDDKTYCLGSLAPDGTCPAGSQVGPLNDNFKRHVFSTTVRLTNISGRREALP